MYFGIAGAYLGQTLKLTLAGINKVMKNIYQGRTLSEGTVLPRPLSAA
jgi:hypothetical protein